MPLSTDALLPSNEKHPAKIWSEDYRIEPRESFPVEGMDEQSRRRRHRTERDNNRYEIRLCLMTRFAHKNRRELDGYSLID